MTLPNLKILELDGLSVGRFLPAILASLMRSESSTLTSLKLLHSPFALSDLTPFINSGRLSLLTDLHLCEWFINDDFISNILVAECPLLENVEIHKARISGISVKALCTRTRVKSLKLSFCQNVSADAVAWARTRGVVVGLCSEDDCTWRGNSRQGPRPTFQFY
jgi:hypothetical protein